MRKRYLADQVVRDLHKKMVLIAGPRQVGKTTLARSLLQNKKGYLNWDIPADRETILTRTLPALPLIVLDEIHKYRGWRNYLKGLYDEQAEARSFLVTGSGRLDYYRFGGDSLQGRYHLLRLLPFTVAELGIAGARDFSTLLKLGGFPEPFLSGSATEAARWSREYRSRIINDDIRSLERVSDLGTIELLVLRLPALVGSPLSVNALREDLQVDHKTVANWLNILERMYAMFRLAPFGSPRVRAVKKAQKAYLLDWSVIRADGPRFENLVAVHLLKWVYWEQDRAGRDLELLYFRDREGRETDFVVTERGEPLMLIESKLTDEQISPALKYLKQRFPKAAAWQVTANGSKDALTPEGIRVCPATVFLRKLI